jgi:myotubularin-related protein 6/7/8
MAWVELMGLKSFERFQATAAGVMAERAQRWVEVEQHVVMQVMHWNGDEAYIKTETLEGWVPTSLLKVEKHKITSDEICELDLRLVVRTKGQEEVLRPTYTNLMGGVIGHRQFVEENGKIVVGIKVNEEIIGCVEIEPYRLLKSTCDSSAVTKDIEVYTQNYKLNYLVLSIRVATKVEEFEAYALKRLISKIGAEKSENAIISFNASAIFNNLHIFGTIHLNEFFFYFTSDAHCQIDHLKVYIQSIRLLKLQAKSLLCVTKDLRSVEIISDDLKAINDFLTSTMLKTQEIAETYYLTFNPNILLSNIPDTEYVMSKEFKRFACKNFKISLINLDYKLCETYPSLLCFPAHISEAVISKVAEFRSRQRVPTVTWHNKSIALYRSSQPMLGLNNRSPDDEAFFSLAKIKYVVDARPSMNAKANRLRGKGYEIEDIYHIKLKFMNIQNIHHVTRSFESLMDLNRSTDEFWLVLHNSKWMSHVRLILEAANCCATHLILEKANVLVHCSDGWDRTAQICALTQVLIDGHYRTVQGIRDLIEKDFCCFGHKFYDRIYGNEYSPIFILFLDCLHQILSQFSDEFEYNQEFLVFLADASLRGLFREFVVNTERERNDLIFRTMSVWANVDERYKNHRYVPGFYNLLPLKTDAASLKVWSFFTRYI